MNTLTLSVLMVVALGLGDEIVGATDPMLGKEPKPTIGERLTKETVKGTLMKMDGEYFWIKDTNGKEIKLQIEMSTKMDNVMIGDRVKAYVGGNGQTTALQRDE